MNLPDPDDPQFQAEARETAVYLFAAVCFLGGVLCLCIALLTR